MNQRFIAALAAALALSAGSAFAQTAPCTTQVEAALKEYGLSLAQMQNVTWNTDSFANSRSPEMGGYQFEGRPASCSAGKVVVELWRSCQVANSYVSGGCSVQRASR